MKCIYTIILSLTIATVSAQCLPDASIVEAGLYDPADNCFEQGVYNEAVWQFRIDTSYGSLLKVDSIVFDDVLFLPCGLSWELDRTNGTYYPNDVGCLKVFGTSASEEGIYTPVILVDLHLDLFSFSDVGLHEVFYTEPIQLNVLDLAVCSDSIPFRWSSCMIPPNQTATGCQTVFNSGVCFVSGGALGSVAVNLMNMDTSDVIGYTVIRKNAATGQYTTIGNIPSKVGGYYVEDHDADPDIDKYTYSVIATDRCGNVSDTLDEHSPMYLEVTEQSDGSIDLEWTSYKGFVVDSHYVYRRTDLGPRTKIATLSNTTFSFSESNPPNGDLTYYIGVDVPYNCAVVDALPPIHESYSNIVNTRSLIQSVDEMDEQQHVRVYPNPTAGDIVVDLGALLPQATITITDLLGKQLFTTELKGQSGLQFTIDGPKGIYLLHIQQGGHHSTTKLVKY